MQDKPTYRVFPDTSPYTKRGRYDNPKSVFILTHGIADEIIGDREDLDVADIGCANGEFLYYLKQQRPGWRLTGYDKTTAFLETGRSFSGLQGVPLIEKNLYDIPDNSHDAVFCIGTFQIFREFKEPLEKLMAVVKSGGFLFVEGLFNPFPVDVRVEFADQSRPEMKDVWRSDFNQHSMKSVSEHLESLGADYEFHPLPVEFDLPYSPEKPATWTFTFKDESGKSMVTSGLNLIFRQSLLVVRK